MEKVKLPREVAEAIEFIRKGFAESGLHDVKWLEGEIDDSETVRKAKDAILNFIEKKGWPDQFSPNHPLIIYHKALINGHEVEETPEDKVRVLFKKHEDGTTNDVMYDRGAIAGITDCLNALGIKYEGVND